jgi:DNA polymerase-3 subunit delta
LRTVAANVEKLVSYSGERAAISGDDVRRILERTRRDPLYEFTDAVTDRNLEQALFYLQSLMAGGEFDHPLPLLAAVANQVRKLLVAKAFTQSELGKGWHSGCAYPRFQKQVLPAVKTFDMQLQKRLDEWQGMLSATPGASVKTKRAKKRKMNSDLALMGRSRSPYPVYRTLIKTDRFTHRELRTALATVSWADRRLKRSGIGGRHILEKVIIGICQRERSHGR